MTALCPIAPFRSKIRLPRAVSGAAAFRFALDRPIGRTMRNCESHGRADHLGFEREGELVWVCGACLRAYSFDRASHAGVSLDAEEVRAMNQGKYPGEVNRISERQGAFMIEKIYVRGHIAGGQHIQGWTGDETIITKKHLMPQVVVTVVSAEQERELVAA